MSQSTGKSLTDRTVALTVLVAALGYFVDVFDMILFSIVRIPSLKSFGLDEAAIKYVGETLISDQMWGMLLGGVVWGVMGDIRGRKSVLFGSIILYSLANLANGFIDTIAQYRWLRFIAGIGLAGELGAGITLVAELMRRQDRGVGTTIVASVGVLGAVFAFFVNRWFDWRTAYIIGGVMGLALLLLRVGVTESGMFQNMKQLKESQVSFLKLVKSPALIGKLIMSVAIGLPTWFSLGLLITFSKEFSHAFGMTRPADPAQMIVYFYVGLSLGDLTCGLLSQWLQSRKKALLLYQAAAFMAIAWYLSSGDISPQRLYIKGGALGFFLGYWAVFITMAAEQFGTNLRATVATSVPNFVRGMLPLMILAFRQLEAMTHSIVVAAWILTAILAAIVFSVLYFIPETFNKNLDYYD